MTVVSEEASLSSKVCIVGYIYCGLIHKLKSLLSFPSLQTRFIQEITSFLSFPSFLLFFPFFPCLDMGRRVRMSLSSHESLNYFVMNYKAKLCSLCISIEEDNASVIDATRLFEKVFKHMLKSCSVPWYFANGSSVPLERYYDEMESMEALYRMRRLGEIGSCVICQEIPTPPLAITRCGHVFCYQCISEWVSSREQDTPRRRICPSCREVNLNHMKDIRCLSSKQSWTLAEIERVLSLGSGSGKIVVLGTSLLDLSPLFGALTGLEIDSVMVHKESPPSDITNFIASPTSRVMCATYSAIQTKIVLPKDSVVISTEAIVYDVKKHLFEKLKTSEGTLSKIMLIARDTVEEIIALEPERHDHFDCYDEACNFVGPLFLGEDRLNSILLGSDELNHRRGRSHCPSELTCFTWSLFRFLYC